MSQLVLNIAYGFAILLGVSSGCIFWWLVLKRYF